MYLGCLEIRLALSFLIAVPNILLCSLIQIIMQLLTNNLRSCLLAFCQRAKYNHSQNFGQFSYGIPAQTQHFTLLYILLPVLWISTVNYISEFASSTRLSGSIND
jgi:hypothetical protein